MSGVLFIICIPNTNYEKILRGLNKTTAAKVPPTIETSDVAEPCVFDKSINGQEDIISNISGSSIISNLSGLGKVLPKLYKGNSITTTPTAPRSINLSDTTDEQHCYGTFIQPNSISSSKSDNTIITRRTKSNDSIAIDINDNDNIVETENKNNFLTINPNTNLTRTKSHEVINNRKHNNDNKNDNLFRKVIINKNKSWNDIKNVLSGSVETPSGSITPSYSRITATTTTTTASNKKQQQVPIKLTINTPLEVIIKEIIRKYNINNVSWIPFNSNKSLQIIFTIDSDYKYDELLNYFNQWGIGDRFNSSVTVLPCSLYHNHDNDEKTTEEIDENDPNILKDSGWTRFLSSVRARLNVAQIVDEVKHDAAITFDFVILLIVAAILAAVGLVEDSTIFLAASMLISPLMGPIIAGIFGTVIKDHKLQKIGVVNEFIGIFLATFVGFLFGMIVCSIDERYGVGEGLTNEMLSRCELHSVLVGILTALPSGAAVAIAILGDNTGSLVGVAISASLLPPAVNTGVLWALACVYMIFQQDVTRYNSMVKSNFYSDNQAIELFVLGSFSLAVTMVNVICIYGMGALFLKIKEVAPFSNSQKQFWKHDIKIARDYNKTYQSEDAESLSKMLADEIAVFHKTEQDAFRGIRNDFVRNNNSHQHTWSPMSSRHLFHFNDTSRPTIHDVESLYLNIAANQSTTRPFTSLTRGFVHKSSRNTQRFKTFSEDVQELNHHHLHQHQRRRSSNPFDTIPILTSRQPLNVQSINYASTSAPLEKIAEGIQSLNMATGTNLNESLAVKSSETASKNQGTENETKPNRKFIVTPVDILKKD